MARSCFTVRAGIACGRTAKVRAGLTVPGHIPVTWRLLCLACLGDWEWQLGDKLRDEGLVLLTQELGAFPPVGKFPRLVE